METHIGGAQRGKALCGATLAPIAGVWANCLDCKRIWKEMLAERRRKQEARKR